MIYIAIGALGFLLIYLFDFISLKRIPRAKPYLWVLSSGLILYSIIKICSAPDKLLMPTWLAWLGWGLFGVSLTLLVHALFISLPFRRTYVTTGAGDKLITTGVYALTRHPGVLWFALVMLSLILVSRSSLLLIASPVWILLNILLVVIEDKFVFGRMFEGYDDYRRETPMLIPNRRSINAFLRSFRQAGSS